MIDGTTEDYNYNIDMTVFIKEGQNIIDL